MSVADETWGQAFGEDGGRIIAAKVQINRYVTRHDRSEERRVGKEC